MKALSTAMVPGPRQASVLALSLLIFAEGLQSCSWSLPLNHPGHTCQHCNSDQGCTRMRVLNLAHSTRPSPDYKGSKA